jgi:hypothetical protein
MQNTIVLPRRDYMYTASYKKDNNNPDKIEKIRTSYSTTNEEQKFWNSGEKEWRERNQK